MFRPAILAMLLTLSVWAQAPAGRWDATVTMGALKVPFILWFEAGSGTTLTAFYVNGDARQPAGSGTFDGTTLRLGTNIRATLADGLLKGTIGTLPLSATAYCTCNSEGAAGPEIMGTWELSGGAGRLTIRRKGDDTFATLTRSGTGDLGPLAGRFNGAYFSLSYFDGTRGAALDIEPRKAQPGTLDVVLSEAGQPERKLTAAPTPPA